MIEYYDNMLPQVFRKFAIAGGFEEGCDIDIVYPYIAAADSIIDLAAGYGRVTKNLIKRDYKGKIYMVECSEIFCKFLQETYSSRACILQEDIQGFQPSEKVDAIVWMWSGIGDFSKKEQLPILKRISSW